MSAKVCVIGIWHLGSIYSACLADLGYQVVGVDKDAKRVAALNQGIPPLFEPCLPELITANIKAKRLTYTNDLSQAVKRAGFVLITFDTPVDDQDEIDLSGIFECADELAGCIGDDTVILVSSQVPVGTCEQIKAMIHQKKPALKFDIAYSPENLRLGQAIDCFKKPERIVVGADNSKTLDKVEELFSVIKAPVLKMNLRSAEMTKHALNAFLATSISFGNEIANLCDEVGADAIKVAMALRTEGRIHAKTPLFPGLGFAGGTLARDLKVLKKIGKEKNYETLLIDSVFIVNERQNGIVVRKLNCIYGSVQGLTVGILGLTYKPGTSTLRRSAALEIIRQLVDNGAKVKAYDPKADMTEVKEHAEFEFCKDAYAVAMGSAALVLITEWPEFKDLDYNRLKQAMKKPVFIDTKNLLDIENMTALGFSYFGIGRGK